MSAPRRIQRRRVKGWRAPLDAQGRAPVYVGRGTRWGNPFIVGMDADDAAHATALYREWLEHNSYDVHPPEVPIEYRQTMDDRRDWILGHAADLAGRDLMCWCAPEMPCHADVLLELANQQPTASPAPTPHPHHTPTCQGASMTDHDTHVQHIWNLTNDHGDDVRIDLWIDDETVHVTGGDGESYSGPSARQTIEQQLLPKYQTAGYHVDSDYLVNDSHDTAGE